VRFGGLPNWDFREWKVIEEATADILQAGTMMNLQMRLAASDPRAARRRSRGAFRLGGLARLGALRVAVAVAVAAPACVRAWLGCVRERGVPTARWGSDLTSGQGWERGAAPAISVVPGEAATLLRASRERA